MKEYHHLDEIQKDLNEGLINCETLVDRYLKNIHTKAHLNVFIETFDDEAKNRAKEIDQKIRSNKAGKLAGLVFGIKDLICYQGHCVSGASAILQDYKSPISATAVERLLEEDAIIIGRQNCDEFGMGSSNEHSYYGPTLNGIDEKKVPGGSSGASAVAVQSNMCLASLGTDTGGSVRQPASFCGVVGIKPSYARVSRWGLLAYASSFDTIGVLTRNLFDAEKILETISGKDKKDATSSNQKWRSSSGEDPKSYRIGYLTNAIDHAGVDPVVNTNFLNIIESLKAEQVEIGSVEFSYNDYLLPTYYLLTMAEASTNLSRYDGVHYGKRSKIANEIADVYDHSRTEGFGDEVRRRLMLGTYVLTAEYHDAYFKKAQQIRRLIKEETQDLLTKFDVIISPTTPSSAFSIGRHEKSPLEMYMEDIFTVQASVAGIPAISIPCGTDPTGMPLGLQIMSNTFREDKIFAFSKYLTTLLNRTAHA